MTGFGDVARSRMHGLVIRSDRICRNNPQLRKTPLRVKKLTTASTLYLPVVINKNTVLTWLPLPQTQNVYAPFENLNWIDEIPSHKRQSLSFCEKTLGKSCRRNATMRNIWSNGCFENMRPQRSRNAKTEQADHCWYMLRKQLCYIEMAAWVMLRECTIIQSLNNITGTSTGQYKERHIATDRGGLWRDYVHEQSVERFSVACKQQLSIPTTTTHVFMRAWDWKRDRDGADFHVPDRFVSNCWPVKM